MNSELARIFLAVSRVLEHNQAMLNAADVINHNHGNHMVEIFNTAAHAAQEMPEASFAEIAATAALVLERLEQNGTAKVYAAGLTCLSQQMDRHQISQQELSSLVSGILAGSSLKGLGGSSAREAEVIKALLQALSAWNRSEIEPGTGGRAMDLGGLFDLGVAYIQSKQRGGSQAEILAGTAVLSSPLRHVPHRSMSGKMAIQALLEALGEKAAGQEL